MGSIGDRLAAACVWGVMDSFREAIATRLMGSSVLTIPELGLLATPRDVVQLLQRPSLIQGLLATIVRSHFAALYGGAAMLRSFDIAARMTRPDEAWRTRCALTAHAVAR